MTLEASNLVPKAETPAQRVSRLLSDLSEVDRVNILLQGFIVGAGALEAHEYYAVYLAHVLELSLVETSAFLRDCFGSLSKQGQRQVVEAAYHRHLNIMKREVRVAKNSRSQDLTNTKAFELVIQDNLPVLTEVFLLGSMIQNDLIIIRSLIRDFSPDETSLVVTTLRELAAKRGFYNDKPWYIQDQQRRKTAE